ncbi:MAG: ExbD/TolR family protein [Saprospiraceae bacterium]
MARGNRETPSVNAGSMADIAFLLLIFFLVTTTIDVDKGIAVKLPPYSEEEPDNLKLKKRNVYRVVVNGQNQLLVRGEQMKVSELRENTKLFIGNNGANPDLSESPKRAIISLQNDRGTKYTTYIDVYNELKAAYNELWDEEAQNMFGYRYKDLDGDQQKEVKAAIPFVISEAEPTAFGEESK